MCRKCRNAILPQLAQPGWYRLVGQMHAKTDEELASAPAKKAIRRNHRKFGKLAPREEGTPAFCLNGCSQPVNIYGQYCGPCREEARVHAHRPISTRPHYIGLKEA